MGSPTLSVIIPVYNRERYIKQALESILAQTFIDFELLIIDDGSTDHSPEIITSFRDSRIHFVRNECNLGIPKTRNRGIELARGKYVAFLDSDDYACPTRLERQLAAISSHPECAMVGCWERPMDEFGHVFGAIKRRPVTPEVLRAYSLFRCGISGRAMMGRTEILRHNGFLEAFSVCEDFELSVRLSRKYRIFNLPEVLIYHRQHPGNIGRTQAALMKQKDLEIFSGQLQDLDMMFTKEDLERHHTLRRPAKACVTLDDRYLKWTESWCLKLLDANEKTQG